MPVSFGCHGLKQKICCHSVSPLCDVLFLFGCLYLKFFFFTFQKCNYTFVWFYLFFNYLIWGLLILLHVEVGVFLKIWDIYSHDFKYIFSHIFFLLSLWDNNDMGVGPFVIIPQLMKFSEFPLSIFSFCCSSWVSSIDFFSSSLTVSCYVYSIPK